MRQKVEYLERTREMLLHACHSESPPIWFMVHGRMNSCLTRVSIREEEQVICSFRRKVIFYGRSDMRRQLLLLDTLEQSNQIRLLLFPIDPGRFFS